MNTSCAGFSSGCCARQVRLAAATSGRSCSAAWAVFFSRQPAGGKEAADRGRADRDVLGRQPGLQLGDGEVRFGRQERRDPLGMVGELGALPAPDLVGLERAAWRQRCISLTTKLGLTSYWAAVAWREAPPSTARTTRSRRSIEYGRVIHRWPPQSSSQFESQQPHVVNPKSIPSFQMLL